MFLPELINSAGYDIVVVDDKVTQIIKNDRIKWDVISNSNRTPHSAFIIVKQHSQGMPTFVLRVDKKGAFNNFFMLYTRDEISRVLMSGLIKVSREKKLIQNYAKYITEKDIRLFSTSITRFGNSYTEIIHEEGPGWEITCSNNWYKGDVIKGFIAFTATATPENFCNIMEFAKLPVTPRNFDSIVKEPNIINDMRSLIEIENHVEYIIKDEHEIGEEVKIRDAHFNII